jgi:[protein-PII] uridylyltransferase
VLWIARAAGFGSTWRELARNGLMTAGEARCHRPPGAMIGGIRIRLHYLLGRREDRLVFDARRARQQLGFADTPAKRASEQLMQRYYRAAKLVRQVNTILLQNVHARCIPRPRSRSDRRRFPARRRAARRARRALFETRPAAILDAFLALQSIAS